MEFRGNVIINGIIECETGLHIGGNKDIFEIGGIDAPVIRDPVTKYPYIPGSSLKGRMRFLLEWELGKIDENDGDPHKCKKENNDNPLKCPICRVFGIAADEEFKTGPTRLIVRDAHPTEDTKKMWDTLDTGLLYTEWKKENYIDRITSKATPRDMERVPKDSKFEFEMVYGIYDMGDGGIKDVEFLRYLQTAMKLLEDSYLGGSGSRGYGKVKFKVSEVRFKSKDDYRENRDGEVYSSIEEAIEKLKETFSGQGSGE